MGVAPKTEQERSQDLNVVGLSSAKGKVPIVEQDAEKHGHDLSQCVGYGNTHADSWFMRICGHAIAVNPESSLEQFAKKNDWEIVHWPS